jgi:hypothetical protein
MSEDKRDNKCRGELYIAPTDGSGRHVSLGWTGSGGETRHQRACGMARSSSRRHLSTKTAQFVHKVRIKEFVLKAAEIVGLYLNPASVDALVLGMDEKPTIVQAH